MRKQDIIVTTPKKSIIYAVGTRPVSSERVWRHFDDYGSTNYKPGYVLELGDKYAVVLVAGLLPDSRQAEIGKQASALDALEYTIKDHAAQTEHNEKFSHWPLSDEQRAIRAAEQAKLKPLPKGWTVHVLPTSNVRMPWAEYDTKLNELIAERAAKLAAAQAEEEAERFKNEDTVDKLIKLGLVDEEEAKNITRYANRTDTYVKWTTLEKLVGL